MTTVEKPLEIQIREAKMLGVGMGEWIKSVSRLSATRMSIMSEKHTFAFCDGISETLREAAPGQLQIAEVLLKQAVEALQRTMEAHNVKISHPIKIC